MARRKPDLAIRFGWGDHIDLDERICDLVTGYKRLYAVTEKRRWRIFSFRRLIVAVSGGPPQA